jgi:hypothetical protein
VGEVGENSGDGRLSTDLRGADADIFISWRPRWPLEGWLPLLLTFTTFYRGIIADKVEAERNLSQNI